MGKLDIKYRNGYLKYTGTTEGSVLHWRAIKESESKLFSPDLLRKLLRRFKLIAYYARKGWSEAKSKDGNRH